MPAALLTWLLHVHTHLHTHTNTVYDFNNKTKNRVGVDTSMVSLRITD